MKICPVCGSEVIGRKDKIFCKPACGQKIRSKKFDDLNRGTPAFKANQIIRNNTFRGTPEGKYSNHRNRAKQSGIPFLISFDEWWVLWKPYFKLGDGVKYCMCRTDDKGAYEVGNVRIATAAENNAEMHRLQKEKLQWLNYILQT